MDQSAPNQNKTQLAAQLSQELFHRYSLTVCSTWLADFLSTVRNPPPPLLALASTANFRLLNSDFTQSLSHSESPSATSRQQPLLLPPNITDVNTKQLQLQTNVPVQVLDIRDVGSSKWTQIEAVERVERGEEVRGREIIRNVPIMNEEDGSNSTSGNNATAGQSSSTKKSAGPHKLLLQDAAGTKVWGFELVPVPRTYITTSVDEGGLQVGAKALLKKGAVVRRGLVMLEPGAVTVMGGKVEEWDRKWRATRKQRLVDELKRENEQEVDDD